MTILKDPDEDITQLGEIEYKEVFSDINTPGYWKAESDSDLQTSKLIVLDGHSTILVYDQSNEDLPWTAYNELGQYKYTPDRIGDGIVIFSHTFYFEFTLDKGSQSIKIQGTFDGNGVEAIALPMKDVSIDDIFTIMTTRIEEAIASETQSMDLDSISEGEAINLPESIAMKVGMKLSLMGIGIKDLKAQRISSVEVPKEEEVIEEVFDEIPTKGKEMIEQEKKDLKKKKKAARSKKKVADVSDEVLAPETAARSMATPSGTGAGGPPPPVSSGPAPPPPTVSASEAKPPPPPAAMPKPALAAATPPPAASPPPAAKPKPMPTPEPREEAVPMALEEEEEDFADEDGFMDMESEGEVDDMLLAKGMEVRDKPMTLRYTHTSYFSRMLLNRAYPLVVKISLEEVGVQKSITSVVSGERISEKEETMIVSEEDPKVVIRPEFPGCFVVPTEQVVDISEDKVEAKFHVTPLALGTLDGVVKFIQSGQTIHSMGLETKVITHRISKWLAYIGGATSAVPFTFAFFFSEESLQTYLEQRVDRYFPSIAEYATYLFGAVSILLFLISGIVYRIQKPKRASSSLAFPR